MSSLGLRVLLLVQKSNNPKTLSDNSLRTIKIETHMTGELVARRSVSDSQVPDGSPLDSNSRSRH